MLVDEVVDPGWLTEEQFFQGFALVQVRPRFSFPLMAFIVLYIYIIVIVV